MPTQNLFLEPTIIDIAGIELEVHEAGDGPPLLYLHAGGGFRTNHPAMPLLATKRRVIAPSHPGFGHTSLPNWVNSVDDFAHIYLELMQYLDLNDVVLIGASIGGWIAAEIATMDTSRISHLVLIGPSGIKIGSRDKLDIPDIFAIPPEDLEKRLFRNPEKFHSDFTKMTDDQLRIVARNRQTMALISWEPYLHNPKLKYRLQVINIPTLLVRGDHDGLISKEYAKAYADLIPDASYIEINESGHAPDVEQSAEFTNILWNWMEN